MLRYNYVILMTSNFQIIQKTTFDCSFTQTLLISANLALRCLLHTLLPFKHPLVPSPYPLIPPIRDHVQARTCFGLPPLLQLLSSQHLPPSHFFVLNGSLTKVLSLFLIHHTIIATKITCKFSIYHLNNIFFVIFLQRLKNIQRKLNKKVRVSAVFFSHL